MEASTKNQTAAEFYSDEKKIKMASQERDKKNFRAVKSKFSQWYTLCIDPSSIMQKSNVICVIIFTRVEKLQQS